MDEPLSNLDPKLRTTMRTELQSLRQKLGTTTIYVTHDQTEVMTMGDRIAILDQGKLQQIGTPLECYHDPSNQFVTGFIGTPSMNFLEVTRSDGALEHVDFTYEISPELEERRLSDESEIVLGIRPEDIQLGDGTHPNDLLLTVDVGEPMGDQVHIYLDIGDQQLTATLDGRTQVESGNEVHLRSPEELIHLFDAEIGEALKTSTVEIDEDVSDALPTHG